MANWQLKKTQTIIGTTGNPSLWTYKQVVYQHWDIENNNYITTNQSRITVETYLGRAANTGSAQSYGGNANTSINIDGTVKNQGISPNYGDVWISAGQWSTVPLVTQTFTVTHASDGTKTISVSSSLTNAEFSPYSGSASGSVSLITIPRGSTFTTGTGTYANGSNVDGGLEVYITKHVSSFYDKIIVSYFDIAQNTWVDNFKTIAGVETGDTITFTSGELDTLYAACVPNSFINIKLSLYSYTDDTYTTVVNPTPNVFTKSCLLNLSNPQFLDFDYEDINETTAELTNDNGTTIIKGYSTLQVSIPVAKKAVATTRQTDISHYIIDGDTVLYSSDSAVTKIISNYNKDNISVYAVDTRNTVSPVVNKSFLTLGKYVDYTNVFKNDDQSYSRSSGGAGEFITLTFSGSWWGNKPFGTSTTAVTNSVSAEYKYRVSGSETWSQPASITLTLGKVESTDTYYTLFSYNGVVNGDLPSHGFDVSKSYDIMVIVSDELSSVTYNFSIHSGQPAIALYKNKASLGDKYDEFLGGSQLWGDVYLNGEQLILPTMGDLNIYDDSEEIVVGKWIDGKPIYRKVYTGTASSERNIYVNLPSLNVDTLINAHGWAKSIYNNWWTLNNYYNPEINYWSSIFINTNRDLSVDLGNYFSYPEYILIIEYTKTTDYSA